MTTLMMMMMMTTMRRRNTRRSIITTTAAGTMTMSKQERGRQTDRDRRGLCSSICQNLFCFVLLCFWPMFGVIMNWMSLLMSLPCVVICNFDQYENKDIISQAVGILCCVIQFTLLLSIFILQMNNCRISRLICCIADGKMSYSQTINQNKATPIWNKYQTSTSYQFSLTPSEFWVKYMWRKEKSKKARWASCFLKMPLHTIQQLESSSHDGKENEGHIIGIGPWIWRKWRKMHNHYPSIFIKRPYY